VGTMLVRLRPIGGRGAWTVVAYSAALVLAGVQGQRTLGAVLAVTPVVQSAPGVVEVYRHDRPSGVSGLTWGLAGVEAICWGAYGGLVGDAALLGYGVVTCTASVLVLARLWLTRGWPVLSRRPTLP
jgi:uncharacterized membrane protein